MSGSSVLMEAGKQAALWLIGISAGGVIAAGVFAFLVMIGVFPRLIGKTGTGNRILTYDMFIVAGGVFGNTMDLYQYHVYVGHPVILAIFGAAVGIFVGCLVMSLAETLKAIPVLNRRIHLSVGLQYVILAIAVGKMYGSILYFSRNLSS